MSKTSARRAHVLALLVLSVLTCGVNGASGAVTSRLLPDDFGAQGATITVTGDGSVLASPDLAVVTVGVEATRATAATASADQAGAARALLDAVHAQGVADQDVVTQGLGLQPVYDYAATPAKLTGYTASETFRITVRTLASAGAVIQAAVAATGDAGRVTGVTFDVADHAPLQAQARTEAMSDAEHTAAQLATLSGHRLGDVVSISESTGSSAPPAGLAVPPSAVGVPPVAAGQLREDVQVTVVYAVGPAVVGGTA